MNRGQIVTGVLLIALGAIFLADRLGAGPAWHFHRLWPVILIVLGAAKMAVRRVDGRRGDGFWLVVAGSLFLLHTYDVLSLDRSWPLFIVAAGVSILMGARGPHPVRKEP